jgi:hypothetical protein
MAATVNPDKHIRKKIYDLVNNQVVAGVTLKVFDSRTTNANGLQEYILLTSQTKEVSKANKCEYRWETSLLIEIYTRSSSVGNPGSRVLLNDIEDGVYSVLQPQINIPNYITLIQNVTFEAQLETPTSTENIFRSFIRLNLTLI